MEFLGDFSAPKGEHVDLMHDGLTFIGIAVAFLVVRAVTIFLIWRPLALFLMNKKGLKTKMDEKEVNKVVKYLWHGTAYLAMCIWGILLLFGQEWSFNFHNIWIGYPHRGLEKLAVKAFLMVEGGWYVHGFVESLIYERYRKDFLMMVAHHVLAVVLIVGSFWVNGHRCALSVIVEQDISDIVLYFGKIGKECKRFPWLQKEIVSSITIILIWGSWFLTRILVLGAIVCHGYSYCYPILFPLDPNFDLPSLILILFLSAFLLMQIVWWFGITKMTVQQLTTGSFFDMWHDTNRIASQKNKIKGSRTSSPVGAQKKARR